LEFETFYWIYSYNCSYPLFETSSQKYPLICLVIQHYIQHVIQQFIQQFNNLFNNSTIYSTIQQFIQQFIQHYILRLIFQTGILHEQGQVFTESRSFFLWSSTFDCGNQCWSYVGSA